MSGFDDFLSARDCVVLKKFKQEKDRCICLVRYPSGQNAVWRYYTRPVPAYKNLVGIRCDELPEVYHYTATDCGGCLAEEEFIDGISLGELIRDSQLDASQTAAIARRVCNALAILHKLDMVHRDVKPENILVTSSGRVVLIDLDAVSPRNSTKERDTMLLGTVGYAAPEQYGFGHSDGRADIFGVGVLMNVLLTGKHPARHLADGPLRKVIEKCIAVNVDQRYETVESLMEQLPDIPAKECPQCGFTSPGGGCILCGVPAKTPPRKQKSRKIWIASALLLLILSGVGYTLWSADHSKTDSMENSTPPAQSEPTSPVSEAPTGSPIPSLPEQGNVGAGPDTEPSPEPPDQPSPSLAPSEEPTPSEEPAPSEEPIPSEEPAPSPEPDPLPIQNLPNYPEEPACKLMAFDYDLDGDGTTEEYYFGIMAVLNGQSAYVSKLIIDVPSTSSEVNQNQLTPVVWTRDENDILTPVPQFSSLLTDSGIKWYQFSGNQTLPTLQRITPLNRIWDGTVEISCRQGEAGTWVAEAHAVLGETELLSETLVLFRDKSSTPKTPVQTFLLTDGTAVDEPIGIYFNYRNDLLFDTSYTLFGCTAQHLDNGYIRFCVDYESPEDFTVTAFDPPDGTLFKYSGSTNSSGQHEPFVFDIPQEQIRAVSQVTIFFRHATNGKFMIALTTTGL